jgi:hypothetical protein
MQGAAIGLQSRAECSLIEACKVPGDPRDVRDIEEDLGARMTLLVQGGAE